jgi:hypothetical protein
MKKKMNSRKKNYAAERGIFLCTQQACVLASTTISIREIFFTVLKEELGL